MEMSTGYSIRKHLKAALLLCFCLLNFQLFAQNGYSVKKGRMYIQIDKHRQDKELAEFIKSFDLQDVPLKEFLLNNNPDLFVKQGWTVELNNSSFIIISKKLEAADGVSNAADRIVFNDPPDPLYPSRNQVEAFGINKFRTSVFKVSSSNVSFQLKKYPNARQVMIAGSFNNWNPGTIAMEKTADGWVANIALKPGKWYYKFIVDGNWIVDPDNLLKENDGRGNTNSVYYMTNTMFVCNGFTDARKVYVSGSFNDWKREDLPMTKISTGWVLAAYLPEGTHTYKFIIDGRWYTDAGNKEKLPDGAGDFNSVLRIGQPHLFTLNGYTNAKQVILSGSFNGWREDELLLNKTSKGWELAYTLGPGNHAYHFKVDNQWIADPANGLSSTAARLSYLIVDPNYTFRLRNHGQAKHVFVAGDFNNWDPRVYEMKRDGNDWVFTVHLAPGKHLYKFIVDDDWIIDPGNTHWEQNEHHTGNSVIWIEK